MIQYFKRTKYAWIFLILVLIIGNIICYHLNKRLLNITTMGILIFLCIIATNQKQV